MMTDVIEQKKSKKLERDFGYDFIRFLATLLILIHHFYTTCRDFHIALPNSVKNIISHGATSFGTVGVALFFILSGAVLILTNKQINVKDFYKKRFARICVPQWIGFIGAYLLTYIINKNILHSDLLGTIISFFGLNYSTQSWALIGIKVLWIIGEWFTAVIILLYGFFPLLRWLFNRHRLVTTFFITLIFLLNLEFQILTFASGWFSITNGLMCFWLGMLFQEHKSLLCDKRIVILSVISAIIFYIINPRNIAGYAYLSCFIFSILLFISLYQIKITNRFIQYICKYSYEIYLTHHRIYIIFIPALLKTTSNDGQQLLAFLFLTGIVFLISEQLQNLANIIINLCKKSCLFVKK